MYCIVPVFSVVSILFASQVSFGQAADRYVPDISASVQRLIDDTQACFKTVFKTVDTDCARASLIKFSRLDLNEDEQYRYWLLMGRVEFFEGNYPEAIKSFRKVAALAPFPEARQAYMRYIAQLYATMGQFQKAYDTLEELMVLEGLVPLARRHLTNDALWLGLDIYATGDWDLVKLVTDLPEFPVEAATQGLQNGYVDLEYTVTRNGSTRDVRVIESSDSVFEASAIEAAEQFRYKPRLVDGKPVEVVVQYRVEYQSEVPD